MLRNDHRIMIQQNVGGEDHWTTLRLIDESEGWQDGQRFVFGSWKHTRGSYNDQLILLTSINEEHLKFTYVGNAAGGILNLNSHMGRGSHRADETGIVSNWVHLYYVQRSASGEFKVGSVLGSGVGDLGHNANPHFQAGDISWTVVRY